LGFDRLPIARRVAVFDAIGSLQEIWTASGMPIEEPPPDAFKEVDRAIRAGMPVSFADRRSSLYDMLAGSRDAMVRYERRIRGRNSLARVMQDAK
jgi:hypothetical protein